jgi:hypothetical protein
MAEENTSGIRGGRTFVAGAIVLLVFGATHLSAVIKTAVVPPATPEQQALDKALNEVVLFSAGPVNVTSRDAVSILNRSYSVLLFFAGVIDLLCWRAMAAAGRLGRLALANMIFSAIIALIPLLFLFPPPTVFGFAAASLFAYSWLAQRASAHSLESAPSGTQA